MSKSEAKSFIRGSLKIWNDKQQGYLDKADKLFQEFKQGNEILTFREDEVCRLRTIHMGEFIRQLQHLEKIMEK